MSGIEIKDIYNRIEPFIWYAVAVMLVPALRRHAALPARLRLAAVICIFGTSDFFESEAWWTPWWLFAWKAISLVIIVVMSVRIRRSALRETGTTPSSPERLR